MKRVKMYGVLLLLAFATNLMGQNWNVQQKEVWNNVEAYWALQTKGDVDGFLSYFSADYMGWDYNSPVPQSKASTAKYVAHGLKNSKTLFYDIVPLAILVYDDIAIVDYYYNTQTENLEAKKQWKSGRWTDILQKQGPRWVLIADHGGDVEDK